MSIIKEIIKKHQTLSNPLSESYLDYEVLFLVPTLLLNLEDENIDKIFEEIEKEISKIKEYTGLHVTLALLPDKSKYIEENAPYDLTEIDYKDVTFFFTFIKREIPEEATTTKVRTFGVVVEEEPKLSRSSYRINFITRKISITNDDDEELILALSPQKWKLFSMLYRNENSFVSNETLLDAMNTKVFDKTTKMYTSILDLRKKLYSKEVAEHLGLGKEFEELGQEFDSNKFESLFFPLYKFRIRSSRNGYMLKKQS
jgi:hypothetical protein